MLKDYRRRWQLSKVKPGDGSALQDYRFWQLFSRSLFALEVDEPGGRHVYEVDVRHSADSTTKRSPASLYRDGVQIHRANVPVTFPVPGGVIEVATSAYGVKRIHYVDGDGGERMLRPHPRSQEGLRERFAQRFPRASAALGAVAVAVILIGLVVTIPQGLETLTHIPPVAEHVGTFTSPIRLAGWVNTTLLVAGVLAAMERALTLRNHWLIDTLGR